MQKEGDGNEVKDSIADFGMYVSESPFKPCDSVKEPPKREWHDEHGDDDEEHEQIVALGVEVVGSLVHTRAQVEQVVLLAHGLVVLHEQHAGVATGDEG